MANNTGKKFGGREKGTPNRLTKELQIILKDLLYREMKQLSDRLDNLESLDRLNIILKFMPYVFPKVQEVQSTKDEPLDFGF